MSTKLEENLTKKSNSCLTPEVPFLKPLNSEVTLSSTIAAISLMASSTLIDVNEQNPQNCLMGWRDDFCSSSRSSFASHQFSNTAKCSRSQPALTFNVTVSSGGNLVTQSSPREQVLVESPTAQIDNTSNIQIKEELLAIKPVNPPIQNLIENISYDNSSPQKKNIEFFNKNDGNQGIHHTISWDTAASTPWRSHQEDDGESGDYLCQLPLFCQNQQNYGDIRLNHSDLDAKNCSAFHSPSSGTFLNRSLKHPLDAQTTLKKLLDCIASVSYMNNTSNFTADVNLKTKDKSLNVLNEIAYQKENTQDQTHAPTCVDSLSQRLLVSLNMSEIKPVNGTHMSTKQININEEQTDFLKKSNAAIQVAQLKNDLIAAAGAATAPASLITNAEEVLANLISTLAADDYMMEDILTSTDYYENMYAKNLDGTRQQIDSNWNMTPKLKHNSMCNVAKTYNNTNDNYYNFFNEKPPLQYLDLRTESKSESTKANNYDNQNAVKIDLQNELTKSNWQNLISQNNINNKDVAWNNLTAAKSNTKDLNNISDNMYIPHSINQPNIALYQKKKINSSAQHYNSTDNSNIQSSQKSNSTNNGDYVQYPIQMSPYKLKCDANNNFNQDNIAIDKNESWYTQKDILELNNSIGTCSYGDTSTLFKNQQHHHQQSDSGCYIPTSINHYPKSSHDTYFDPHRQNFYYKQSPSFPIDMPNVFLGDFIEDWDMPKARKVYIDDRDRMIYVSWIPKRARAYNSVDKRRMEFDLKHRLRKDLVLNGLTKVLLFPPRGVHCKLIFDCRDSASAFMLIYGGDNCSVKTEKWKEDLCKIYDIDMHDKFHKTVVKIEWSQK